jgi:hypothetical protein
MTRLVTLLVVAMILALPETKDTECNSSCDQLGYADGEYVPDTDQCRCSNYYYPSDIPDATMIALIPTKVPGIAHFDSFGLGPASDRSIGPCDFIVPGIDPTLLIVRSR